MHLNTINLQLLFLFSTILQSKVFYNRITRFIFFTYICSFLWDLSQDFKMEIVQNKFEFLALFAVSQQWLKGMAPQIFTYDCGREIGFIVGSFFSSSWVILVTSSNSFDISSSGILGVDIKLLPFSCIMWWAKKIHCHVKII